MNSTVADPLIDRLIAWGVDTVFSLPSDGVNGIYEALRTRHDRIRLIQVRHEKSVALPAGGYAKFTRRLGVCLATSGPGGIHLLNELYDAKSDGQPVLVITEHTFYDLIGAHYQQDLSLDKLFSDVALYSERVMGPAHVSNVLDEAIKTAISRRTVAHITIQKDIRDWSAEDRGSKANICRHREDRYSDPLPLPSQSVIERVAAIINAESKIAILA